jgi:hypothetical protein
MKDPWLKSVFLTSRRSRHSRGTLALILPVIVCLVVIGAFGYSPGQDHFGAIPLPGDDQWYANYVIKEQQIQDTDIFYHGIGRTIANLRQTDIVFLGTSRVLFGIDWRTADDFAKAQGIRLFNMAFAGVMNGEFSHKLITKWNIHPRLWVIDIYADDVNDFQSSFFNPKAPPGFEAQTLAEAGRFEAYANVISRNMRWRAKMLFRSGEPASYRSDRTGNWYLDKWPNRLRVDMPKMDSPKTDCPASPQEMEAVRDFAARLKGPFVLTETPSKFSCFQRVHQIASALGAPLFAPDPVNFSTTDAGGHLDGRSSVRYTRDFQDWLAQTPTFRRAMAR